MTNTALAGGQVDGDIATSDCPSQVDVPREPVDRQSCTSRSDNRSDSTLIASTYLSFTRGEKNDYRLIG